MPINKSALTRYRIIDSCIRNTLRPYPSKQDLAEKIMDVLDMPISESMVEKDIRVMKEDQPRGYGAPIVFNRERGGYYYAEQGFSITGLSLQEEEWDALKYASALLYQYAEVPMFGYFKEAIEKIDLRFGLGLDPADSSLEKFIHFENSNSHSGYNWLGSIYKALRERWLLNITYENIYKLETKEYFLQPCYLKEYRNRWYVTGWVEARKDYLTFALDRIQSLEVIQKKQKHRQDFKPELFLKHAIGVMEQNTKPQKISLAISKPYNKLIALEPLHSSQRIIKNKPDALHIEIEVYQNEELYHRLLAMGPYCMVLKPLSLKNKMLELLKQTLKEYQKN